MAAVHRYGYKLWKLLEQEAKPDNVYGEGKPVFRGKYTDVWVSVGASQTYYSRVRAYLKENEFIDIAEQGSRNRDSIIVLVQQPPPDVEPTEEEIREKSLTTAARFVILEERLDALGAWRESLGGINLQQALINIEARLARLESSLPQRNGKAKVSK